ncbi:MAG: hypothetical protein V3T44_06725 [bacterium]
MSRIGDAIRNISGWEGEAEAVVKRSEAEARRILEEVRTESRETAAAVEARCAAERETLLQDAVEEGNRQAGAIARQAEGELEQMQKSLSSRQKAAVDLVLKEMRALYGGR